MSDIRNLKLNNPREMEKIKLAGHISSKTHKVFSLQSKIESLSRSCLTSIIIK